MIPQLWMENEEGHRFIPYDPETSEIRESPPGFKYMRSRFVRYLRDEILVVEGGKSRHVLAGSSGYSEDFVLALTRPSWMEKLRAFFRYGSIKRYRFDDAVIMAADGCERCMNALAHRAGLKWGYRKGSDAYVRAGTSCEFCKPEGVVYVGEASERRIRPS